MTDRTPPPPLAPRCPDCSICGAETNYVDESFECDNCGCYWPDSGAAYDEPGEWHWPDRQCDADIQPFVDNQFVDPTAPYKYRTYRCLLGQDHDGKHRHPAASAAFAASWSEPLSEERQEVTGGVRSE